MDSFLNNIDGYISKRFDKLESYIEERVNNKLKVNESKEQDFMKDIVSQHI